MSGDFIRNFKIEKRLFKKVKDTCAHSYFGLHYRQKFGYKVNFQFQHFSLNCNLSVFTNKQ